MENVTMIKAWILAIVAGIGSAAVQFLGGWDVMLKVLAGFMIVDYLTGFLVAFLWHKSRKTESGTLDSKAGAKGLARKMLILVFVGLGAMLDRLTGSDFLRDAVCLFYIGNEGLSVLENTAIMGVPYPKVIQNALEILKEKGDEGKEPDNDSNSERPEQN